MRPVEILLVEDSPGDVLCVRQTLAAEPIPIRIRVAVDGEQAIQILAEPHFHPNLVILNLNLPKVFGLLVLERSRPAAPVVVFTSSANPQFRQRALELGAKDYVQKPIHLAEYREAVSHMVQRWAWPEGNAASAT
jgi:DNA-binding response OmpR family regulator